MKRNDLMHMCLQNLLRRKSRTILTVLGVFIGCCSIVIMVSLGIGMKETQDKLLSEMGDLTIITVNAPQGGRGKLKLDDPLVKRLRYLSGVEAVTPKQSAGGGLRPPGAPAPATAIVADWTHPWWGWTPGLEKMGYTFLRATPPPRAATWLWASFWPTTSRTSCAPMATT